MKILVVEDDRKVAGFIEQGLKEEGFVVDVAPDGDEATRHSRHRNATHGDVANSDDTLRYSGSHRCGINTCADV